MKKTGNPVKIPRSTIYIPEEVIAAEILPLLPVKSLLKFRCVSKSWCYLISSSKDLIKSHLNNSTGWEKSLIASQRANNSGSLLIQNPLDSLFKAPRLAHEDFINAQPPIQFGYINLVGSCNGLCCLITHRKPFFLWNPATKKHHKLPEVHDDIDNFYVQYQLVAAGFGFDEVNNDYKVLAIYENYDVFIDHGEDFEVNRVKVFKLYSLKTNCWKEVKSNSPIAEDGDFPYFGKFLNGKLHWHVSDFGNGHIVSFDSTSEVFGLVERPNNWHWEVDSFHIQSVGVLDGCLSCLRIRYPSPVIKYNQVWVMQQYGIIESWHLLANISDPIDGVYPAYIIPIHMAQGGEILFADYYGYFIYDPKTKSGRYLYNKICHTYLGADVYVESLVSPVPVGESEMPGPRLIGTTN